MKYYIYYIFMCSSTQNWESGYDAKIKFAENIKKKKNK